MTEDLFQYRLKRLRGGMSIKEFAQRVHQAPHRIELWEKGDLKPPRYDSIWLMEWRLGVPQGTLSPDSAPSKMTQRIVAEHHFKNNFFIKLFRSFWK